MEQNEDYIEINEEEPTFAEGTVISEETAKEQLKKRFKKAKELLEDDEKVERFLQRLEAKIKLLPMAGETLSEVPVLISLVRNYIKKEYNDFPIGSLVAVVGALLYFLSPVDLIPDFIPGAGYLDDISVLAVCLKLVDSDVSEYRRWREKNGKVLSDEK